MQRGPGPANPISHPRPIACGENNGHEGMRLRAVKPFFDSPEAPVARWRGCRGTGDARAITVVHVTTLPGCCRLGAKEKKIKKSRRVCMQCNMRCTLMRCICTYKYVSLPTAGSPRRSLSHPWPDGHTPSREGCLIRQRAHGTEQCLHFK
jgi:hypothetical protein